jgi:DNA-binding response OmpR family regulator
MNPSPAIRGLSLVNTQVNPNVPAVNSNAKKILIVDDNALLLKALSMKLRASGYDVSTAVDGSGAVSTVRQQRPDLILLDISFPPDVGHGGGVAWDGFLILNWLRRMDEAVNTPVIIITGCDPAKYKDRCLAAGVAGFFPKPINNEELLAAIAKVLPANGSSGKPTGQPAGPKKILFVDDETDWRFMASVYLQDAGYDVLAARNGTEALSKLKEEQPDLVLLDLNLAGENGLEILKTLKAARPNAKILLYTGMEHDLPSIQGMLQLGAHQYLRKGTMGEMLQAVQTALASI